MNKFLAWMILGFVPALWLSAAPLTQDVTFGGFVDSYYGYDFGEPSGDRSFTTQAIRSNEFSVNLAYLEARLATERVRGRLALQTGTSVYANTSSERRYGPTSSAQLADLMRYIQEAYGGYQIADNLWLDAGIFFSHIGAENFISKNNWVYTRSLGADFTPYFQAGVRLSYRANKEWSGQLDLMNGWQNMIETNTDKAIGMQIAYSPSDTFTITYNNFIGREAELRVFNEMIVTANILKPWSLALSLDVGAQKKTATTDYSVWHGETLLSQWRFSPTLALGGRLEYFNDKDQVLVITQTPNGFQTMGASLNLDWQPEPRFLVRGEVRSLFSKDAVFAGRNGLKTSNTLLVSSLAVSF